MRRMAAVDATAYWMGQRIPNDQFLLYCFAIPKVSATECGERLLLRASHVDDLCLRVHDIPLSADRPYWVAARPTPDQVHVDPTTRTWSSCLDRVAELIGESLVPSTAAWRLHVFGPVLGAPTAEGATVVVVLQISHALADGRRASRSARELFAGTSTDVPGPRPQAPGVVRDVVGVVGGILRFPFEFATTLRRGIDAARAHAAVAPARTGYPLTAINADPGRARSLRVIVLDRTELTGGGRRTVTVAVLTAISIALPGYLGESTGSIGVELTVGKHGDPQARNHFRNVGIDLHTDVDGLAERSRRIGEDIAAARRADDDPARVAQRRASHATPAVLARWGVRTFDLDTRPDTVTGVTVVSSVNRGTADLELDGGRVLFTSGFPALSPVQGLTHGVHGIGDRVAVSVTTSPDVLADVDRYVEVLTDALAAVAQAEG